MIMAPRIRLARPSDIALLQELYGRCSARTGYQRFHGPVRVLPRGYVADCVDPENLRQLAYVAEVTEGGVRRLVGLGSAAAVPWTRGIRELGVIVEDEWQRQGVGDALVRALYAESLHLGDETMLVEACTTANPWMPERLARRAAVTAMTRSGCDVSIETDIALTVQLRVRSDSAA